MRRSLIPCALLLAASGCGNFSNRDLEFVTALPTREALRSNLPTRGAGASGLHAASTRQDPLNVGDRSEAHARSVKAAKELNAVLDFLLGVVDTVRSLPPTSRTEDSRIWGPWADPKNPGLELRVVIVQVNAESFAWGIEARPKGGEFFQVLAGNFAATQTALKGQGAMVVKVKELRSRFTVGPELAQVEELVIGYFTDGDPRRVNMAFTFAPGAPSGLSSIGYASRERGDGAGALHFLFRAPDPKVSALELASAWTHTGAGQATGYVVEGSSAGATVRECWDAAFLVTYYSESWAGGQTSGKASDCVDVSGL